MYIQSNIRPDRATPRRPQRDLCRSSPSGRAPRRGWTGDQDQGLEGPERQSSSACRSRTKFMLLRTKSLTPVIIRTCL